MKVEQSANIAKKPASVAGAKGVEIRVLIAKDDGAPNFAMRMFEVQPGGYSTLELHRHPHAVVVLRGTGQVVLGEETHAIAPHDCVYVAPGAKHQFRATGTEPLGFLCVVDRVRDRPVVVRHDKAP